MFPRIFNSHSMSATAPSSWAVQSVHGALPGGIPSAGCLTHRPSDPPSSRSRAVRRRVGPMGRTLWAAEAGRDTAQSGRERAPGYLRAGPRWRRVHPSWPEHRPRCPRHGRKPGASALCLLTGRPKMAAVPPTLAGMPAKVPAGWPKAPFRRPNGPGWRRGDRFYRRRKPPVEPGKP